MVTLAFWALLPAIQLHTAPLDGRAFVATAHTAANNGDVYNVHDPTFVAVACGNGPANCTRTDFASLPAAVPILLPLAWLPAGAGDFVMRLLAVACLVGSALLWRRRFGEGPTALACVFVTPLAMFAIGLGQVTPLVVLLGSLTVAQVKRWPVLVSFGLAAATAFKLFPVVLILLALVLARRVGMLAVGWLVVLTAAAAALGATPAGFITASRYHAHLVIGSPAVNGSLLDALPLLAAVLAFVMWRVRAWQFSADAAWAIAPVAVLVPYPQVWENYLLLGVAAVGVSRPRWMWAVGAVSMLAVVGRNMATGSWLVAAGLAGVVVLTAEALARRQVVTTEGT
jgi:hypothetical protein